MEAVVSFIPLLALAITIDVALHAFNPYNRAPLSFSLLRALGVALSVTVIGTIVGLYIDLYTPRAVPLFLLIASLVVIAIFGITHRSKNTVGLISRYRGTYDLVAPLAIAFSVLVWSSWTEPWNFLVATSMDAGNYEVYANFWASSGSLYMDLASIAGSVDLQELFSGSNTWIVRDDWTAARPSYLYGFPALLAVSASVFGTPGPSWVVMALLAAMNSWGILLLGKRFSLPTSVAVAGSLLALVTPIFAYYSKQIMSEPLALLGVLLILFGILGTSDLERPDPWFLASGLVLALTSKIDALLVVLLLIASCAAAAAMGRWPTRTRPTLFWGLAGAVSTSAAGAFNLLMADPRYLSKSTIAGRIPVLEGIPLMETPLYGVLIAGASIAWLAIPILTVNRQLHVSLRSVPSSPIIAFVVSGARVATGFGWLAFLYWLYAIRPRGAILEVGSHDSLNAIRLIDVHSEAGLLLIAVLPIIWLTMRENDGSSLMVSIPLLAALTYFVLRSNHNPAELWWMRRYLITLTPLTILGVASAYRLVSERCSSVSRQSRVSFAGVLAILVATQVPSVALQQHHVQNPSAPRVARELANKLDESDVLLIRADSRIVRGVGMSGAALVGTQVVPSMTNLRDWEKIQGTDGRRLLLTDRVLKASDCACEPVLILTGHGEAQWASWQLAFRRAPHTYLRTAPFWLYGLEGGE